MAVTATLIPDNLLFKFYFKYNTVVCRAGYNQEKGPQGEKGDKGDKGDPGTDGTYVTVGSTTTLPAGSNATVSRSYGYMPDPYGSGKIIPYLSLGFGIPKGDYGYELTQSDKQEIATMVLNSLPNAYGQSF